jgi:hypothetical protein
LPAAAQDSGSLVKRFEPAQITENAVSPEVRARRALRDFAICTAQRSRAKTDRYLQQFQPEPETRLAKSLASSQCLWDGQLKMTWALFRGALYEAVYREDFRKGPVADLQNAPVIDYLAGAADREHPQARVYGALRRLADCAVRADPAAALRLVATLDGTMAEADAFRTLVPRVSGCVVAGQELKFSRPMLRGLVAETLYRLSVAQRAGPASPAS